MRNGFIIVLIGLLMIPVAGCRTQSDREHVGSVVGGAIGGVLGSTVGKGVGRTAAIVAGTVAGSLLGREIARQADEARAQRALEYNYDGQSSSWNNPNTGANFTTTPTSTYLNAAGENCREYQHDIYIDGKRENGQGTACRQPDGSWRMMD
ncbi:hypothetical protein MMIC_P2188 [Mariprofundus micogutta]|uniref:Glycine zipper 2TM domain-containing protein n=1 Tax=Mariprofundus micogutta TaxID=1921010 RepID=A0A1L8CQL2_9PROT|nr:RT0821/Lpp0805 family surface protein [Mariprofundus micogutta]GAV21208.1 hypothetical protein MMIC_P2188 [Mariprofundus micogutta]